MVSMLVSVKTAKFLRPVLPGDRCLITVDIKTHDDYAFESGVVDVDGVRVSRMELLVAFKPRVIVEPLERDVVIEAWRRRQGEHNEPIAVGAHAHTIAG
jgi:hypothetical protein